MLLSMSAFIYIVGLNQQKWGEDHELNEESAEQERKTEQFAENMKQEEFLMIIVGIMKFTQML